MSELDCTIYVDQDLDEVVNRLESEIAGSLSRGSRSARCVASWGDIDFRMNPFSNPSLTLNPDGFLFFRTRLEFYFVPATSLDDRKNLVGKFLQAFWDKKVPAVAACDYEDDLPARGGYKNPVCPWSSAQKLTGTQST